MRFKRMIEKKSTTFLVLFGIIFLPAASWGALIQFSANSGEVRDLLQTAANTLYAATQGGGIYKSTDGGINWTRLASFPEHYVWRLAGHSANNQLVYAANGKGLFKSADGGTTWTQLTFDSVKAVAVDPFNQNHLLIGVPGAGIYQSLDGGTTFALVNTGLDSLDISAIAFSPVSNNVVYAGLNSNVSGGWGGSLQIHGWRPNLDRLEQPRRSRGDRQQIHHRACSLTARGASMPGPASPGTIPEGYTSNRGREDGPSGGKCTAWKRSSRIEARPGNYWAGTRSFGPWRQRIMGAAWSQAVEPDTGSGCLQLRLFPHDFCREPPEGSCGVKGLGLIFNDK